MRRCAAALALAVLACLALGSLPVQAVTIEIDDVASDRVERQRAFAEGSLPLPGTPDLGQLQGRLAEKGLKLGAPVFVRVFKSESELEVWMQKDGRYVLFATYPICHWAGTIGPKLREGDKQNPEGFYSVGARQLHRAGRWPRSLNLGFPNTFDRAHGRTGSWILVHGGCSSVGCFAMTNAVMAEIFTLAESALWAGQQRVHVHVFPFRMTEANLAMHARSPWYEFWRNLKEGYDAFHFTHVPPRIGICDRRYVVEAAGPEEVAATGPLALCGALRAAQVEPSFQSLAALPPYWPPLPPEADPLAQPDPLATPSEQIPHPSWSRQRSAYSGLQLPPLQPPPSLSHLLRHQQHMRRPGVAQSRAARPVCNPGLASCRKFLATRSRTDRRLATHARMASSAIAAQLAAGASRKGPR